jgi:hypothetical protein
MPLKSAPLDDLYTLKGKDLENFGFARVRDLAYDAVQDLWQRRKAEGWTQIKFAENLDRDTGWLSKKLQGPGNWTFRTFGALVQGLGGELEIKVFAAEDPIPLIPNYHAYVDYGVEPTVEESESSSVENNISLFDVDPVINRQTLIEDDSQQINDTSRRYDGPMQPDVNELRLTTLEA